MYNAYHILLCVIETKALLEVVGCLATELDREVQVVLVPNQTVW